MRGYHVYKDIWTAVVGEEFPCKRETGNTFDPFAVAVMRGDTIVISHIPRKISSIWSLFLRRDWEGHSALKPHQSSCTETLLAPHTVAACAIQIFAAFIFEHGANIQNIQKSAPFKNFLLYSINIVAHHANLSQPRTATERSYCAHQPEYTLPCPLEVYQKPLKFGYLHIMETQQWSLWCLL